MDIDALREDLLRLVNNLALTTVGDHADLAAEILLRLARIDQPTTRGKAGLLDVEDTSFEEWLLQFEQEEDEETLRTAWRTAIRVVQSEQATRETSARRPPIPVRQRRALHLQAAALAPYNPLRTRVMLDGLQTLVAELDVAVRLNHQTGLVRTLQGDLHEQAADDGNWVEIAEDFTSRNSRALFGIENDFLRWEVRESVPDTAVLQQTDDAQIPVFGASAAFGFHIDGRLRLVNSNWQPLPPESSFEGAFILTAEEAAVLAEQYVTGYIVQTASFAASEVAPLAAAHDSARVIFPDYAIPFAPDILSKIRHLHVGRLRRYRPAYQFYVVEKQTGPWWVIVDAATPHSERPLLIAPASSGLVFYSNNDHAIAHETAVNNGLVATDINPLSIAGPAVTPDQFDLGPPVVDLAPTPHPSAVAPPAADQFRAENTFYHLARARWEFRQIAHQAWTVPPPVPGETNATKLPVTLSSGGGPRFAHPLNGQGTGRLYTGAANFLPHDAALDCEVIYHEYAHAVINRVQHEIQLFRGVSAFNIVLDEGFAYYFAVSLSRRIEAGADTQWGNYAYRDGDWQDHMHELDSSPNGVPDHDFLHTHGAFPQFDAALPDYPAGTDFLRENVVAVLWARALWQCRGLFADPDDADAAFLRGMRTLVGVQGGLETAALALLDAVEDLINDGRINPGGGNLVQDLQDVFLSRNIMVNQWAQDLAVLTVDGVEYVAVGVSGPDVLAGCYIRRQDGGFWQRVGIGNVGDVVAVTAVSSPNPLLCIATKESNNNQLVSRIRTYELADGAGQIDLSKNWANLPAIVNNGNVNILSLAALRSGDTLHVFAGSAQGLHHWNAVSDVWAAINWNTEEVLSIAIMPAQAAGQPPLLVVGGGKFSRTGSVEIDQQGAFTGNNNRIKRASFGLAAATLSGPAGECFLLGTLKSNTWHLYHHDNRTTLHDDWTMVPVPADRPLCCLAAKMTPGGGLMVYAGTNDGVYVYDQAADAWQAWNDVVDSTGTSLAGTTVVALARQDDIYWAATAERGLWRRELPGNWEPVNSPP